MPPDLQRDGIVWLVAAFARLHGDVTKPGRAHLPPSTSTSMSSPPRPPSPPLVRISPDGDGDSPSDPSSPPSDLPLPLWQLALDTLEHAFRQYSYHTAVETAILLSAGLALGLIVGGNAKLSFLLFGLPPLSLGALIYFATSKTDALLSSPVGDPDPFKHSKDRAHDALAASSSAASPTSALSRSSSTSKPSRYVAPVKTGTLIARRTMEEHPNASSSTISSTIAPYLSKARGGATAAAGGAPQLPPEQYYAKLSGDTLYLHKTMDFADSQAIGICLEGHEVALWPENTPDAELFAKRNCIKVYRSARGPGSTTNSSSTSLQDSLAAATEEGGADMKKTTLGGGMLHSAPWYFFIKSNTEMEDWYLALKHAASPRREENPISLLGPVFNQEDMRHLRDAIDSAPDAIPMRWLNAMFGRIFLGVNRTQWLQDFITTKIQKKLSRVVLSPKLSPLIVTAVSFSAPAPSFSTPILKNLTEDGEASMEVKLAYKGEVSISVATTVTIQLPFAKEPRTWPMGLTISVKELEGDLIVMMKKPPSARLWYGFREMPKVTVSVVPMFSTLQISWKMLLSPIENQIKEIIAESVVWPNMDDIPWFDTTAFSRGGIFADAVRKETVDGRPAPTPDVPSEVLLENLIETTESLPTNANSLLRKRNGTASSMDSLDPAAAGLGIKRVETAPPDVEKSSSSSSSYRTWLTGGARKSSGSSADTASLPPTVVGGSSLKAEASLASSSASVASAESGPSALGGDLGGGGDLARTNSAGSGRSIPSTSERSSANRAGHQSSRSTSSIPASDTSSAPSTSPTTTMSILGNLRDKKSREEALAKGISFAKGFQGMKEARSLWNRKVAERSNPSAAQAERDDESGWHQRYVEEERESEPSLYAGSLSSRAGKAGETSTSSLSTTPPRPEVSSAVPLAPSPLHGRTRADSASARIKAPYIDPYALTPAQPSISATTVTSFSTSSTSPSKPSSTVRPPSIHRSHGSHTSGSSIIPVPPPSAPTTQLSTDSTPLSSPANTPSTQHTPSFSSPSQQDDRVPTSSSSTSSQPVRNQMPRSKMMAVPAIPKDRKAEQMSFGSTPPEEVIPDLVGGGQPRTRLGSIYQMVAGVRMPASATAADVPIAGGDPAVLVDTPEAEKDEPKVLSGPPPLPSRPITPAPLTQAPEAVVTASSPTTAAESLMNIASRSWQQSSPNKGDAPALPPRRSFEVAPSAAPALPPRSPSQAPKEVAMEEDGERVRGRETEVKPAQIRSRSDSEDASGREMFSFDA